MMTFLSSAGAERATILIMFALYLITSVQIIRYSTWLRAGQPNPFLPGQPRAVAVRPKARPQARDADLSTFRVY